MKNNLILLLIFTLLSACTNTSTQYTTKSKFTGLWSLIAMEQYDEETGQWSEWRNGMQGYLLYDTDDHMALHLTTKGYQDTDLEFPNFTDTISLEALQHLTNSYVYFAKYTIDEEKNTVQHARISHSNPSDWNKVVQRKYSFHGDTLILQPVEKKNSMLRVVWVKD